MIQNSARSVLFNLFVIEEALIYFRFFHGIPINNNLRNIIYLGENQIFVNRHLNK